MIFNLKKGNNLPNPPAIVRADTLVTLLGAGELNPGDLSDALSRAPLLVSADGGADHALELGHVPAAVIGDMDSLSRTARDRLDPAIIHQIDDQDSTDFDKALRNIEAPAILAVGFTGLRLDHQLAAFHVLAARPERRCVLLGREDIVFHLPPDLSLDLPPATRLSLFPMSPVRVRGSGLRWPVGGVDFRPAGRIGTSNETVAGRVELSSSGPGMLVILPRAALDAALSALSAGPFPLAPAGGLG